MRPNGTLWLKGCSSTFTSSATHPCSCHVPNPHAPLPPYSASNRHVPLEPRVVAAAGVGTGRPDAKGKAGKHCIERTSGRSVVRCVLNDRTAARMIRSLMARLAFPLGWGVVVLFLLASTAELLAELLWFQELGYAVGFLAYSSDSADACYRLDAGCFRLPVWQFAHFGGGGSTYRGLSMPHSIADALGRHLHQQSAVVPSRRCWP